MDALYWTDHSEDENTNITVPFEPITPAAPVEQVEEEQHVQGEVLFEVFTEHTESIEPLPRMPQLRNNIWSNRHNTPSLQTLPVRRIVNYADQSDTSDTPTIIRRVMRDTETNNFRIECLNLDSYLENLRDSSNSN